MANHRPHDRQRTATRWRDSNPRALCATNSQASTSAHRGGAALMFATHGAAACLAYTRDSHLLVSQGMSGTDTLDGLLELAASASRARGDGLHTALARAFARTLKASTALISHAAEPGRVRTLAVFADGAPQPNYEYALAGTPCAAVCMASRASRTGTGRIRTRRGTIGLLRRRSPAAMERFWDTCAPSARMGCH
jgi:hypothetical protein